jgi:polar amino acid transport system substrate-binding protein
MKRTLLAALVILALPLGRVAAGEKLVVASCNFEPYFGESLKDGGPLVRLTRMALEKAGYEVEVKFLPWARVLKEGEAGKIDVIFGMWRSPEREGWVAFSEPLVDNEVGLYRRHGAAPTFTTLAELKGAGVPVGSVRGYVNPAAVQSSGVTLDESSDDEANVKKLLAGRIQVALVDKGIGAYIATRLGKGQDLEWVTTLERKPLLDAVVKTSGKDWKKILADLNRELAALKAKGATAPILKEGGL